MPPEAVTPTPGAQRIITFTINGGTFAFRRPSRADEAEVARRTAVAIVNDTHDRLDGLKIQFDSQLEVGLRPRVTRTGEELNLGETAPAHWLEPIVDFDKKVIGQRISFANVMLSEYNEVVEYLTKALAADPNAGTLGSSSTTVQGQTNG